MTLARPCPQYEEEVGQLNEVAHQKPRDALVQGIQQENRHLRELQQVRAAHGLQAAAPGTGR